MGVVLPPSWRPGSPPAAEPDPEPASPRAPAASNSWACTQTNGETSAQPHNKDFQHNLANTQQSTQSHQPAATQGVTTTLRTPQQTVFRATPRKRHGRHEDIEYEYIIFIHISQSSTYCCSDGADTRGGQCSPRRAADRQTPRLTLVSSLGQTTISSLPSPVKGVDFCLTVVCILCSITTNRTTGCIQHRRWSPRVSRLKLSSCELSEVRR